MIDRVDEVTAEILAALPQPSPNGTDADGDEVDEAKTVAVSPHEPYLVAQEQIEHHYQTDDCKKTLLYWRGTWMGYTGAHWTEVEKIIIQGNVYEDYADTYYVTRDQDGYESLVPWQPNRYKVADTLAALQVLTHLPASSQSPSWIGGGGGPAADHIVSCRNGLLDVHTRTLHEHTPDFFTQISVPFDHDPAAPAPAGWLAFLNQLWRDDPEQIAAFQEYVGYVLSGRTDLHRILLVVGPRRAGKGTIARILTALIGKGNVAGPTLASLGTNFGLAPLLGKPLAIISDARLGGADTNQVVERLLSISGEDTISVDVKYRLAWTGRLPTRFIIMSNELPRFGDASGAIVSRFLLLQLTESWLGKEDFGLEGKLLTELPGILTWALDGLARLIDQGRLTEPRSSLDAISAIADMASPVSAFVRDHCVVGPGRREPIAILYGAWGSWCITNGRDRPGTIQTFGRDLRAAVPGIKSTQPRLEPGGPQVRCFEGICLAPRT